MMIQIECEDEYCNAINLIELEQWEIQNLKVNGLVCIVWSCGKCSSSLMKTIIEGRR